MAKKLNLGCGSDYKDGWINVDCIGVKKDLSHNLNKIPYPFKNNIFDEILMRMILEHVDRPLDVLREVIRISKNGAKITIIVPHARSLASLTDLQHKTHFTENSFSADLLKEYNINNLVLKKKEFLYKNSWKKYIPFKRAMNILLNGVYDDILFEFKVVK